jgi:two-component system, cell cycle sensor histidine kinase and response regulator CckA
MPPAEAMPAPPAPAGPASWPGRRVHRSVVLILLLGAVAAGWVFQTIAEQERARAEAEFHRRATAQHLGVHQTLAKYEHLLASIQRLHDPTPGLMTNQVEASAGLLRSQGMPLVELQWCPRVLHAERAAFEAELRQAGVTNPVIREFTPAGHWAPAAPREDYFPRRYYVPLQDPQTLGSDFSSVGEYREPMLAARDTGEPALGIRRGTNQLPMFAFILPFYPPRADTDTVAARRTNLVGFLLAHVRGEDLAVNLSQVQRDSGVDMLFIAPAGPGSNEVAHFVPNAERPQPASPALAAGMRAGPHQERRARISSLALTFLYRPAPEWWAAQRTLNRWGALGSALLLAGLAAGFVQTLHRRRELVEALVNLRTAELRSAVRQLRESENLYQSLVHTLPQFIFRKDREGRFTFVNAHVVKALGRPAEAILGRTDAELFPAELAAKFRDDDERVMSTGQTLEFEERTALGPDVRYARVSKTALRDEAGQIVGLQGIAWDNTERHRFVEALRESETRFRAFMDNLPAPAWLKDDEFRYAFVNPALEELYRQPAAEVLGREDGAFMSEAAAKALRANDLAVLAGGEPQQFIEQVPGADGWPRQWLVVKFPFTLPDGRRWTGGVALDITARVEAVTALRQREEQMRLFVEHTPAAVAMLNRELRYVAVSRRWLEDYRLGDADIIGRSHYEVFPEIPERWKEIHRRCLAGAMESCEEDPFPRADGCVDWVRWAIHPWRDAAGQIGGLIFFTEVITERKLARQAVERRDAVLRAVARTADELVRAEPDGPTLDRVLAAIGAAAEVSRVYVFENHRAPDGDLRLGQRFEWTAPGVPPRLGDPDLRDTSYRERGVEPLAVALAARQAVSGHARTMPEPARVLLERHGTRSFLAVPIFTGAHWWGALGFDECRQEREWTTVETDALHVVAGVLGAAFERQRAEQERASIERKMVESQKLESLGVLAGGIAHDFNNLLTSILGNASLLRYDLPKESPLHPALEQIEKTSLRAADLCKQMLAYSGRGRFQLQRVDLARLVADTTHLLEISISKKAVLRFNFAAGVPPVEGDPTQLRQIVMNLVINASEAIGERSGIIALTTGLMRADQAYLATTHLAPELPPGDYVFLEVSDNGCGMAPEVMARIFDPFYSTKFTGRGLGLAAVLGIVRGHRGTLKVYSEPGKGATFKLLLPAAPDARPAAAEPAAEAVAWRGSGHVLVVDDEPTVRSVATSLLHTLGFTATVAEDGRAGIEAFRRQPDAFTLALMDLTMPHYDGVQTFGLMRRVRPEVRVILMSGFNEQDAIAHFTGKGLAGFLQKPFDLATLAARLRVALEERGDGVPPAREDSA